MRDSRMRLRIRTVHLERAEMCEDHGGGVCIGCPARGRSRGRGRNRVLGRWMESPLQEMNVCCGFRRCTIYLLDFWLSLGRLLARKREDELRILASRFRDTLVCVQWDDGADGGGVICVSEAPEGFDFLCWEIPDLLHV